MRKAFKILSIFFGLALILFIATPIFAQTIGKPVTANLATDKALKNLEDRIQKAKDRQEELRLKAEERASKAATRREEKLTQVRLRVCEARKKGITKRVKFMLEHGVKLNRGYAKIQQRVDEYYKNQLAANGYELENYDELLAAMDESEVALQVAIDNAKASGADFDCSGDDPKSQIDNFKDDMKDIIAANKEYKSSVHDFVKAVLSLAKDARAKELSEPAQDSTTSGGIEE